MGYRIEYDGGERIYTQLRPKRRRWIGWASVAAVCTLAVALMIPAVRTALWYWILPGNEQVTASALENLAEDLGAGEKFGTAFEAFCQEIIADGY